MSILFRTLFGESVGPNQNQMPDGSVQYHYDGIQVRKVPLPLRVPHQAVFKLHEKALEVKTNELKKTKEELQMTKSTNLTLSKRNQELEMASNQVSDKGLKLVPKETEKPNLTVLEVQRSPESASKNEDDPNKLWCICQKTHNNRFMIACDTCSEWFHGSCVGISAKKGKEIEDNGYEWTCPKCCEYTGYFIAK